MFSTITYQKGALVLNLLRNEMGDDAFFLALKKYLTDYAYDNAEIDDLRRECERVSGKDFRDFFNQWFFKAGHPIIELRYDYNDSLKLLSVSVEQKQDQSVGLYKFPLKFKVTQAGQTKFFSFDISKRTETFFVKKFDPRNAEYPNVFVDPDGTFIGEIKDNKPFLNHIKSYYAATNYLEKIRSLKELNLIQKKIDTARSVLLDAINDSNDDIRAKAIEWIDWTDPRNVSIAKDVILLMARNDRSVNVRLQATAVIAAWKQVSMLSDLKELSNDSSYAIAAKALEGIYSLSTEEAVRLCAGLEKDARRDLFSRISVIYANAGTEKNAGFYENNLMKVLGRSRINLMNDYTDFCIRLHNETINNKAISLFKDRAIHDQNDQIRVEAMLSLHLLFQKWEEEIGRIKDPSLRMEQLNQLNKEKDSLNSIINQEKDTDAINLLKMKGLLLNKEDK
jgi:aminopeptidase N